MIFDYLTTTIAVTIPNSTLTGSMSNPCFIYPGQKSKENEILRRPCPDLNNRLLVLTIHIGTSKWLRFFLKQEP